MLTAFLCSIYSSKRSEVGSVLATENLFQLSLAHTHERAEGVWGKEEVRLVCVAKGEMQAAGVTGRDGNG